MIVLIDGHIYINELVNLSDRTLIYGNDYRGVFHFYLKNGTFNCVICNSNGIFPEDSFFGAIDLSLALCIPSKSCYPESCDYEFVKLLKNKGYELCMLGFNDERYNKVRGNIYHGLVI